MEFIKDMPLDFEPGSDFQHSNTGYDVAGAVIEKITGADYYDFIRKVIYEPAGMKETDSFHRDGPVKNLAMGYTNLNPYDMGKKDYSWNNTYIMPPRGTPAGGGYSTTGDLLKFVNAFINHKILSREYTDFFFNRLKGNPGDPYVPTRIYRAVGGAPGISAFIGIDNKTGYAIIVLSNFDHPAAMNLASEIIKMLGIE
jgi:CubicO group peptidase (beta-lactamase class C family)